MHQLHTSKGDMASEPDNVREVIESLCRKDAVACLSRYFVVLESQQRRDCGDLPFRVNRSRHIKCDVCGKVSEQVPHDVLAKNRGCAVCAGNSVSASRDKYLEVLVQQNRTDISIEVYGNHLPRLIHCNVCGDNQSQTPHDIVSGGSGCSQCSLGRRGRKATDRRMVTDNLVGRRFGSLEVKSYSHTDGARYWLCLCDCGRTCTVVSSALNRGNTKSCGCLRSAPEIALKEYVCSLGFLDATSSLGVIRGPSGRGLGLDVYVPSKRVAFEYCGLRWHGQILNGKSARSKHVNKLKLCQAAGIRLITIFADEWLTKQDIVKDRIAHVLGVGHRKVGARKCDVVEIPTEEAREFVEKFHLQGACRSQSSWALKVGTEVVAVAMFLASSHTRKGIATRGVWELVRYAVKSGVSVQGGLSKILRHFSERVGCTEVVSFSDRRWSDGGLYRACGFKLTATLPPDYRYFKCSTQFPRMHKFGFRVNALAKKFGLPIETEWKMAQAAGFDRIWDCGLDRWVWCPAFPTTVVEG